MNLGRIILLRFFSFLLATWKVILWLRVYMLSNVTQGKDGHMSLS